MARSTNDQTVQAYLSDTEELPTAAEIAESTGISLSGVYAALGRLNAERVHVAKNTFGYRMPDALDFDSVTEHLGVVQGKSWHETARKTMRIVAEASVTEHLTPEQYADGFEHVGNRFLELAAHARAAQDRPDWKIILGFTPDTEKDTADD